MTEKDIRGLFANYRDHEVELSMIENCTAPASEKYNIIMRRLTLVDDWLRILSKKQGKVVIRHLIEGTPWSQLSSESNDLDLPSDERALQRIQQRALQRLCLFTNKRFGDALDYLTENNR